MNERKLNLRDDGAKRVRVMLPLPLNKPFDYLVFGVLPPIGTFVSVTFSGRQRLGVVWNGDPVDQKEVPFDKLKPVDEVFLGECLTGNHLKFIDWVSHYVMFPIGSVLKMSMNVPKALGQQPTKILYFRDGPDPKCLTPEREVLLEALMDKKPRSVKEIAQLAFVSEGVVRGLIKVGTLTPIECQMAKEYPKPDYNQQAPKLSEEQLYAANQIKEAIRLEGFLALLLEGVTGSGKTEVYFEGLVETLKQEDSQILVLLPEIALTSQWLQRFRERFGTDPVEWHSDLGGAERRRAWRAIASGDARVVVGARSSLFLPFKNLKLIVVDEEHDGSFKQEEGVLYHARDMAVVKASLEGFPIILASATPSFESLENVKEGKYKHLTLKERHGIAILPEIEAIDLRANPLPTGKWISERLRQEIEAALGRDEQALLFLNRRGYAPLTLCRTCGERINCSNCSAWLVEHRYKAELMCHHCGFSMKLPKICPECGSEDSLMACGPGVERLEEEVAGLFPEAKRLIMTSDTVTSPLKTSILIEMIQSGSVDIIIGTQIVTKGYHFPKLTTVGVVDADLGLNGSDLRAVERTYQQMVQVAGRAGRENKLGRVFLQTYMPEHPVTQALIEGDNEGFIEREMAARKLQGMPPYGKLGALIITGPDLKNVIGFAKKLAIIVPNFQGLQILGPAPAPMAKLKGLYRFRFLIISDKKVALQTVIRNWLEGSRPIKGVEIKIDIDPISFF
ncbi:MAG: primosomal protein N' [Sphingomonadales bacterium]